MHDQAYNFTFHQKLESFQCNASRVITVTVRATSRENLYQEFCLELLQERDGTENFADWFAAPRNMPF